MLFAKHLVIYFYLVQEVLTLVKNTLEKTQPNVIFLHQYFPISI